MVAKKTAKRKRKSLELAIIPAGAIENLIFDIRGLKVVVDADPAAIYGTDTRSLEQQVIPILSSGQPQGRAGLRSGKCAWDNTFGSMSRMARSGHYELRNGIKRDPKRFPSDFKFELSKEEVERLFELSPRLLPLRFGKVPPMVFTEQGLAMLTSVLNRTVRSR